MIASRARACGSPCWGSPCRPPMPRRNPQESSFPRQALSVSSQLYEDNVGRDVHMRLPAECSALQFAVKGTAPTVGATPHPRTRDPTDTPFHLERAGSPAGLTPSQWFSRHFRDYRMVPAWLRARYLSGSQGTCLPLHSMALHPGGVPAILARPPAKVPALSYGHPCHGRNRQVQGAINGASSARDATPG